MKLVTDMKLIVQSKSAPIRLRFVNWKVIKVNSSDEDGVTEEIGTALRDEKIKTRLRGKPLESNSLKLHLNTNIYMFYIHFTFKLFTASFEAGT